MALALRERFGGLSFEAPALPDGVVVDLVPPGALVDGTVAGGH